MYFTRHAALNEAPKTVDELRREIEADEPGEPWVGDDPERQWAQAMVHFSLRKLAVAKKPGFDLFAENWLLIDDSWPLPGVDTDKALRFLEPVLQGSGVFSVFRHVFVLDSTVLCEISASEARIHMLMDPRKDSDRRR